MIKITLHLMKFDFKAKVKSPGLKLGNGSSQVLVQQIFQIRNGHKLVTRRNKPQNLSQGWGNLSMLWPPGMKSSLSTQVLATNSTYLPLTFPLKFRVSGAVSESVQVQEPEKKQQQNSMRKLFDQIRTGCLGKLASFHMIRNSKTIFFNLAFFFLCFW